MRCDPIHNWKFTGGNNLLQPALRSGPFGAESPQSSQAALGGGNNVIVCAMNAKKGLTIRKKIRMQMRYCFCSHWRKKTLSIQMTIKRIIKKTPKRVSRNDFQEARGHNGNDVQEMSKWWGGKMTMRCLQKSDEWWYRNGSSWQIKKRHGRNTKTLFNQLNNTCKLIQSLVTYTFPISALSLSAPACGGGDQSQRFGWHSYPRCPNPY